MKQTVRAVLIKDLGYNCPYCKSDMVQAVENGFKVDGNSTDLLVCYNCEQLYIVYAEWYLKRKPKQRDQYPKDIVVEISDDINAEKERLLSTGSHRIARKYRPLIIEELKKGSVRFSEFVKTHPVILRSVDEIQGIANVLHCADIFLPEDDIQICLEGNFAFETEDGFSISGDDFIIMLKQAGS